MARVGEVEVQPGQRVHVLLSPWTGYTHQGAVYGTPIEIGGVFQGTSADGALLHVDAGAGGSAMFLPEHVLAASL